MIAKPTNKRRIVIGVIGLIAVVLCVVSAALVNLVLDFFRPIPETPTALASTIPITPQNMEHLEPLYRFNVTNTVESILWSSDSHLLAVKTEQWPRIPLGEPIAAQSLSLWDITSGNGRVVAHASTSPVWRDKGISNFSFSSDGRFLNYKIDSSIRQWIISPNSELPPSNVVATPEPVLTIPWSKIPQGAKRYALSPNNKVLAVVYSDSNSEYAKLVFFDAISGNELKSIAGSRYLFFSHDSKMIATLDMTKMVDRRAPVILWDVESGQVLQRLDGNVYLDDGIIAFSPDGKWVAGRNPGIGGITYMWNVSSGRRVMLNRGWITPTTLQFSPDGRLIAIGTSDGTVQLWGVRP